MSHFFCSFDRLKMTTVAEKQHKFDTIFTMEVYLFKVRRPLCSSEKWHGGFA